MSGPQVGYGRFMWVSKVFFASKIDYISNNLIFL